jgi:predicted transcriptional regulator
MVNSRNIMKNRSRMDIAASLLQVAEGGAKKTHIMYKAFVSYPQLMEYVELLTEQGLLEYVKEENMYSTTDKGNRFLKIYGEMDKIVPKENMLTKVLQR